MHTHLLDIAKHVLAEPDIDRVLATVMDAAIELTGAERGLIILFDQRGHIRFHTARNLNKEELQQPKYEISRSIIDRVRQEKQPVYLRNAREAPEFQASRSVATLKILSVICLPLFHDGEIFGAVYLDNRSVRGAFTPEQFEFAQSFADFIAAAAHHALEQRQLHSQVEALHQTLREAFRFDRIIGRHPAVIDILNLISQVADTDAAVLLQGESGSGKELVAHALHENSRRADKPFIAINCGALPDELLESELFGHRKGAFTGATSDKVGWFERAYGGTIFLDEVAEMSPAMQVKLLRVLQNGEFSPVGSTTICHADARVIAASNKNLQELVQQGTFRDDLYYRLNVITIQVPPLRERRSDIPLLAAHFIDIFCRKYNKTPLTLTDAALSALNAYDFPGNIRELENIMQRAVILATDERIEPTHLPAELLTDPAGDPHNFKAAKQHVVANFERRFISERLSASRGNISQAARDAGMDVKNFFEKMKKYGIDAGAFKT